MTRKKQYLISLDYPPEKQARLKKFIGVIGIESIRAFVFQAIENEIEDQLAQMTPNKRAAVRQILGD